MTPKSHLALWSVVTLSLTACAHCAFGERAVEVDFLWVRTQDGVATSQGGTTRARVALIPNPDEEVRVGVFEDAPGSIGEAWRATVWMSAVMSALRTGQSLASDRIMVDANGFIDAPSAGSLITAAMIAARRGTPVREGVTMTGTVNPDGSIGPVGGLRQKVLAALREGKKYIGYPTGQGILEADANGRRVAIVDLARRQGAEAVEIHDIEGAHALLTGEQLESPTPLTIADMDPNPALADYISHRAQAWLSRARHGLTRVNATVADPAHAQALADARTHLSESERYLARGDVAAAHLHAYRASVEVDMALILGEAAALGRQGTLQQLADLLRQRMRRTEQAAGGMGDRLKRLPRGDIHRMLVELDAFEVTVAAYQHLAQAAAALQSLSPALRQGHVQTLLPAVLTALQHLVLAEASIRMADETLALPAATEPASAHDPHHRHRLGELFTRAAMANLHYFDNIYLEPLSRAGRVSREEARRRFANRDDNYFKARGYLNLATGGMDSLFGHEGDAADMLKLASALSSFFRSSSLIARYDAFQVENEAGTSRPKAIGRERVFWRVLALAELKARTHAAVAQSHVGAVPNVALLYYQIGRVYSQRPDIGDRLTALEAFWRASLWCQLATAMAGH